MEPVPSRSDRPVSRFPPAIDATVASASFGMAPVSVIFISS
jgi:hypothetical protein